MNADRRGARPMVLRPALIYADLRLLFISPALSHPILNREFILRLMCFFANLRAHYGFGQSQTNALLN